MNFLKIGALTSALFFSQMTLADVIGVKGEAGIWRADYSGDMGSYGVGELGFNDEDGQYVHLYAEHPVPFIPNARISYADISSNKTWRLGDIDGGTATIDLTHIDATAYYELLDNWINIDAGLSLRKFEGRASVSSPLGGLTTGSVNIDDVIPLGYLLVEADLPFTGWSAGIEVNYTEFDDYFISDNTIKLRYLFDALLDVGFEIGYRQFDFDLSKGFGVDLDLSGPFAGFAFHF